MIPVWIFWLLLIELIIVSIQDIQTQKIANIWSVFHLMFYVFCLLFESQFYHLSIHAVLYSMVIFLVGFVFFLLKIMGAGDTKFLATFYFLIPEALQPIAYKYLLISTLIIGLFMLMTNLAKNFKKISDHAKKGEVHLIRQYFGTKFSFAPVILLSWIWMGFEKGLLF